MAIKLEGNYSKRLGLPGYSSHQFSVSCETELSDLGQVQSEVSRLYELLQDAVDREIVQTGFVPRKDYGATPSVQNKEGLTHNRLQSAVVSNDSSDSNGSNGSHSSDHWACSDKQRELILKLVTEHHISRDAVNNTAHDRFGVGVKQLNKLQASGLITELIEVTGNSQGRRNGSKAPTRKGGGR